jgi:hypothetical protein
VRAGRTYISTGPLLDFTINKEIPGTSWDCSAPGERLRIRAEASCWTPFTRIHLLWNGKTIAEATPASSQPTQAVLEHEMLVQQSGWLAVHCEGPGLMQHFAHSSAVAIRLANAPNWAQEEPVERFLQELDRILQWVDEKAHCETTSQREKLAHVFEEARTALRKKLSS